MSNDLIYIFPLLAQQLLIFLDLYNTVIRSAPKIEPRMSDFPAFMLYIYVYICNVQSCDSHFINHSFDQCPSYLAKKTFYRNLTEVVGQKNKLIPTPILGEVFQNDLAFETLRETNGESDISPIILQYSKFLTKC